MKKKNKYSKLFEIAKINEITPQEEKDLNKQIKRIYHPSSTAKTISFKVVKQHQVPKL